MLDIFVDADSCPVKNEIFRSSMRHELEVYWVSNKWTTERMGSKIHKILVPLGADIADNWIVNNIKKDDIVITADILLAKRCLEALAFVITPYGKNLTQENIGISVAMRNLNSQLREIGEIGSFNKPMTNQVRSCFLQQLESVIQMIKFKHKKI